MTTKQLDKDQQSILYVYSKYSSEKDTVYLQYTAALVIFYFLMKNKIFPLYKEQLLVYDYKDSRKYMWEDKKFMEDVNVVRDFDFLNRARLKTAGYRDLNAHYCTQKGLKYIEEGKANLVDTKAINKLLKCKCGNYLQVHLEEKSPVLRCTKCRKKEIVVEGFLYNLSEPIGYRHTSSFL